MPPSNWIAITIAILALVISVAGWFVNHRLSVSRDRQSRIRAFKAFLISMTEKSVFVSDQEFPNWFMECIPQVVGECAKVQDDISRLKTDQFKTACTKFRDTKRSDIEDKQGVRLDDYGIPIYPTCKKGRERLHDIFESLVKSVD